MIMSRTHAGALPRGSGGRPFQSARVMFSSLSSGGYLVIQTDKRRPARHTDRSRPRACALTSCAAIPRPVQGETLVVETVNIRTTSRHRGSYVANIGVSMAHARSEDELN